MFGRNPEQRDPWPTVIEQEVEEVIMDRRPHTGKQQSGEHWKRYWKPLRESGSGASRRLRNAVWRGRSQSRHRVGARGFPDAGTPTSSGRCRSECSRISVSERHCAQNLVRRNNTFSTAVVGWRGCRFSQPGFSLMRGDSPQGGKSGLATRRRSKRGNCTAVHPGAGYASVG